MLIPYLQNDDAFVHFLTGTFPNLSGHFLTPKTSDRKWW